MKGEKRQFEKEPGKREDKGKDAEGMVEKSRQYPSDIDKVRGLADSIYVAHAIEHDPG